jgi:serine/threonine protein kinase
MCSSHKIDVNTSQANVLIDDIGRACIADFGLSKIKYDALSQANTTKGQSSMGTIRFMSPEMMEGKATKEGDVYSFGMVGYQVGLSTFSTLYLISASRCLRTRFLFKWYLKTLFSFS